MAEEIISEVEDTSKNPQKQRRLKKKKKQNIQKLYGNYKGPHTQVMGKPEVMKKGKEQKKYLKQ